MRPPQAGRGGLIWRTIENGTRLTEGVQQVEIRFMRKDRDSNVGNCPAMYKAPGGYVIQGKKLDAETRTQLRNLGSDEDGVFVPANVIDRIKNT
jgi:hypothetical protein